MHLPGSHLPRWGEFGMSLNPLTNMFFNYEYFDLLGQQTCLCVSLLLVFLVEHHEEGLLS